MAHLRRMKAVGAFSVKSYNQQRRDARQMIIKAARELQMMVVPEGGSLVYMNETMVQDGHTGVEHSLPVPTSTRTSSRCSPRAAPGTRPRSSSGYGGLNGENYWYQHQDVWANTACSPSRRATSSTRARAGVPWPPRTTTTTSASRRARRRFAMPAVAVQLGAHGQLQGLGAHWELWMLAQGGLSPMQALAAGDHRRRALPRASTTTSARSKPASSPIWSCSTRTRWRTSATATACGSSSSTAACSMRRR